jgi:ubiquinone/menaquinone biosynthesis C-methylase UbiE
MGVYKYNSIDIYNLVKHVPINFYKLFFKRLQELNGVKTISHLEQQLEKIYENKPSDLNYVVNKSFNLIPVFQPSSIDIVFSQAAFEHFVNVEETVKQLSMVCKQGAVIVAEIDLQTHSRWIREKDPNNIYRYSSFIYNMLYAKTTPNRIRPYQYVELFKNYGWQEIKINPKSIIDQDKQLPNKYLNKVFRDDKNEMHLLSTVLLAKKK